MGRCPVRGAVDSGEEEMTEYRRHETWETFVPAAIERSDPRAASQDGSLVGWAGGSWEEAIRRCKEDGYKEAIDEVERLAGHVKHTVMTERELTTFVPRFDVSGSDVEVTRYLQGEPECMIDAMPFKISKRGRSVRLVVNSSFASTVDEKIIRRRGAAVMALADCLTMVGHPLEIWVVQHVTGYGGSYSLAVLVQSASEVLDVGRVMYAVAHPTMLRRMIFAYEEGESYDIRRGFLFGVGGGNYGHPSEVSDDMLPEHVRADGTPIILPQLRPGDTWDDTYAVKWIEQQLDSILED